MPQYSTEQVNRLNPEANEPGEGVVVGIDPDSLDPLHPQTLTLLGLLTEGILPLVARQRSGLVDEPAALRGLLDGKLAEVVALILRTPAPVEEAAYALEALNQKLIATFDLLYGRLRSPFSP